jgi:hypothetical protein
VTFKSGIFNAADGTAAFTIADSTGVLSLSAALTSLGVTGATTLTGAATLSSTLGVTGAATLSSTLAVTGASTFSGDIKGGTIKAADGTAAITIANSTGAVALAGDLTVSGTTTTVDTALTVSDATIINNAGSDVGLKINSTSTGHIMQLQDNGTDVLVVKDGGNVGVGTAAPDELLQIGSTYRTCFDSDGTVRTLQSGKGAMFGYHNATAAYYIQPEEQGVAYRNLALCPGGGNVGISTATPAAPLDIKQSTGYSSSVTAGTDTLMLHQGIGDWSVGRGARILWVGDVSRSMAGISSYVFGNEDTGLSFETGGAGSTGFAAMSSKMVIDHNGNVGIGTTTPTSAFQLVNNTTPSFNINRWGFNGGNFMTFQRSTGASAYTLDLLTVSNMVGSSGIVFKVEGVSSFPGNGAAGIREWTLRAKCGDSSSTISTSIYASTSAVYNGSGHATPVLSWSSPTSTTRKLSITFAAWGGGGGTVVWGGYTAGIKVECHNAAHG